MTELRAEGLGFAYGDAEVFSDVDVVFDRPGLVSVLGPNGVGKSTFMNCLNGIFKPTEGAVYLDGVDLRDINRKEIARTIAFVPHASEETFSMTVMDTVLMGRYPHSGYAVSEEDVRIAAESLDRMEMSGFAMRNFDELSAGQHQKVMIARGLAQCPRVLMLDEPTSNLDIRHQIRTMKVLRDIAIESGTVVVAICHDLNIASRFSHRIVMMYGGGIYADGHPNDVITAENIRRIYGVDADVVPVEERPYVIFHTEG